MQATGLFDVRATPETGSTRSYGRVMLTKRYHGVLDADATGEMLTGGDPKMGTAGYVALEAVNGTLDQHRGSFQLMHWGTMAKGRQELRIAVVPGSGTGALVGLEGAMEIKIAPDGTHSYEFEYTLPRE